MRPAVAAAGKPQIDANVSRFPRHLAGRLHLYGDLLALGLRPLGPRAPSLHEQPGQRVEELDLLQLHLVLHRRLRESTPSPFQTKFPTYNVMPEPGNRDGGTNEPWRVRCVASARRYAPRSAFPARSYRSPGSPASHRVPGSTDMSAPVQTITKTPSVIFLLPARCPPYRRPD